MQNGDDDVPIEEDKKQAQLKKLKWDLFTKMFHDPDGIQKEARDKDRSRLSGGPDSDNVSAMNISQQDGGYVPLQPEYWKKPFLDIKLLNIIKMPRVLQTLFYLLGYESKDICEPDTNKLDLKLVRPLLNDTLFQKMALYEPIGEKREEGYKEYQMLAFLKKNIESVEEEKVDEYSVIMGRIHRWVSQAIELRIDDVRSRRDNIATLKHDREVAMAEDAARTEKRRVELE